jgi:pterin-4a-carbinolamine dehydratase
LRAQALDAPLRKLADIEPEILSDDHWEAGLESLIAKIAHDTGLPRRKAEGDRNPNGSPARPLKTQSKQVPLSDAQVRSRLEPLGRWQLQWGAHPWGIGGQAQEITRSYDFDSFAQAIDFISQVSTQIDKWKPPHHPRWENQWRVVTVWFTTWDVDCRVTKLDIEAAEKLDKLYRDWRRGRG